MEEFFYNEGGETLEQVAQRGGRCPLSGIVKARLDRVLSNLISLKMSLLITRELD